MTLTTRDTQQSASKMTSHQSNHLSTIWKTRPPTCDEVVSTVKWARTASAPGTRPKAWQRAGGIWIPKEKPIPAVLEKSVKASAACLAQNSRTQARWNNSDRIASVASTKLTRLLSLKS